MDITKTVKVANGLVQGRIKSIFGRDIVQFLSIPYCKPPVGKLRFQRPQPCESFSDQIINKLEFETCQPQFNMPIPPDSFLSKLFEPHLGTQDEDSLCVNVWCPLDVLKGNEKQPVFIYIHGGGFVFGASSSETYDGSILSSQQNIIVVSFNYRIGIAGFLCLDDFIKGNMGIWDQVLALKWIYDNISVFNGDRENMTLGGCSAGAASVSLHLLIQESWPHFSKVAIHSGVCLADWSCLPKEELMRRSEVAVNEILEKYKYPMEWSSNLSTEEKKIIVEYLQNINITEYVNDLAPIFGIMQFAWAPCIDGDLIKDNPKTLFESGKFKKCPTVIQHTANEGSIFFVMQSLPIDENNQIHFQYFQKRLEFYPYYPISCKTSTLEKIKSEYHISGELLPVELIDKVVGDEHFVCPSIELADIISNFNEKVFFIIYNTPCETIDIPKWIGVFHGSDANPLFGNYLKPKFKSTDSDKEFCKHFMEQYGYFLKNGTFPESLPYYATRSKRYISIERKEWISNVLSADQCAKVEFWKTLRQTYEEGY